jgi:ANTAR domain
MMLSGLAGLLEDAADILAEPVALADALDRVIRSAQLVPGAAHASISVRHLDGTLETVASTDPSTVAADLVQHELQEGPFFDAATDQLLAYSADLAREERWPLYGPKAAALGLHAQLTVCLYETSGDRAALNIFAVVPGAFDGSQECAYAFACLAKVALSQARTRESLTAALQTRGRIGQAVGITMERYDLDDVEAFQYLVRSSQNSNTKLRDIAAEIVAAKADGPRDST